MSNLPRQIREQAEQVERMMAAAATAAQDAPAPTPAPVAEPPRAPDTAAPAEQPAVPATEPTPAPAPTLADPEETWEKRYKTLQGMHNRNMADMKARAIAAEQKSRALAEELAALKSTPPAPTPDNKQYEETFGRDLVEMATRIAESVLSAEVAKISTRLSSIETKLSTSAQVAAQTAEEVFLARLKEAVPDYATINSSEDFLLWLGEEDPVYGVPRQAALTAAAEALDAGRVAKVFNAFKAAMAPKEPQAPAPRHAASELERQIAPSTAAAQPSAPAQPHTVRVHDIQSFYNDVRLGRYRGREAEQQQIEARINAAIAAGHVV